MKRQSIDQNLRKLAETAGCSKDIYAKDYSGYFKKHLRFHLPQQKENSATKIYLQSMHIIFNI